MSIIARWPGTKKTHGLVALCLLSSTGLFNGLQLPETVSTQSVSVLGATAAFAAEAPASGTKSNADFARPQLIIDAAEVLAAIGGEKRPIAIDVRSAEKYAAGHLAGALHVNATDWGMAFTKGEDASHWSRRIGNLGISKAAEVVVYDDQTGAAATRAHWLLQYWGVPNVRIVNGGWQALQSAGIKPETKARATPAAVEFTARSDESRLIGKDELTKAHRALQSGADSRDALQFVDTRSEAEYRGERNAEGIKRPGTIPGARNLPSPLLIDEETGRLKSPEELRRIVTAAEINLDRPTVTFSNHSGRSAHVTFVLELLGAGEVRIFPGGFEAWSNDESLPVAAAADRK